MKPNLWFIFLGIVAIVLILFAGILPLPNKLDEPSPYTQPSPPGESPRPAPPTGPAHDGQPLTPNPGK